jgi:hypothetical protein
MGRNDQVKTVNATIVNNEKKNGILDKLLGGGDSSVKLITLALIVVSGGSNFWATKDTGRLNSEEAQRAISQLRDLHNALDDFEKRQKEQLSDLQDLLRNQATMLKNQGDILTELKKPEH